MDWTSSQSSSFFGMSEEREEGSDTMIRQEECKKCCFKRECCSSSSSSFNRTSRRRTLFSTSSSSFLLLCCNLCRHGLESSVWDCNSGPGRPKTMPQTARLTTKVAAAATSTNSQSSKWSRSLSPLLFSVILITCSSAFLNFSEACSSRSAPRPRFSAPTTRPNITFQTYACPEAYARWYCLNGATCFSVRIGESILYNCECADGFMGQRCEFKDLDGSYLPSRERLTVAQAGVCGGVLMALAFTGLFIAILKRNRKERNRRTTATRKVGSNDEENVGEVNFGGHVGGHGHHRQDDGSARIEGGKVGGGEVEEGSRNCCSSSSSSSSFSSSISCSDVCETSIIDVEKGMTGYIGLNWAVKSGLSRQTNSPTNRNGLELTLTAPYFLPSHHSPGKVAHCRKETVLEQLDPDSGRDGVLLSPTNQPIYGQKSRKVLKSWKIEESHAVNNMDSDLSNNSKNGGPAAT